MTFRVGDAAGGSYVLRRPPLGAVLATAHDMAREHRIISGVGKTTVPVPPALGLCEDEAVNDAPFYVMGFVEGVVLTTADDSEKALDEPARDTLSASTVGVLADLHSVDPDAVGLGTLGKKEDYLARQLHRWRKQWEGSKTRELETMETVAAMLDEQMPQQIGAAIVHGDYRLGNCIAGEDARIAAVLDWELCTLGDPLADVGFLLNDWVAPGEAPFGSLTNPGPSGLTGFWDRDRMMAVLRGEDGAQPGPDRLLPRLPVLAPRRHRRGGAGALPQGRDGQGGGHRRTPPAGGGARRRRPGPAEENGNDDSGCNTPRRPPRVVGLVGADRSARASLHRRRPHRGVERQDDPRGDAPPPTTRPSPPGAPSPSSPGATRYTSSSTPATTRGPAIPT